MEHKRNILFDPAFILALLAIMLFGVTWAYSNVGEVVPGMILGISHMLPPPVIVYNITTVAIGILFGWLLFLAGRAIYHRRKKTDTRSPELKALDKLNETIETLSNEIGKLNK